MPDEDNIPNKFRILKERHIQMRKPYRLPGWTKNSSYYSAPVGDRTRDLPPPCSFIMAKVSHALNHSAMAAVNGCVSAIIGWFQQKTKCLIMIFNYRLLINFLRLQLNTLCFALKMLLHVMIHRPISLMEADIIPSSHRRGAEIFKMASHEPTLQSIVDSFG